VGTEPWRIREVYLFWTDSADYWEDVSDSIDLRIAALGHHDSQVNGRIDKIAEWVRNGTSETGKAHGYAYAEAFKRIAL
jgi:hypothetical protein